MENSRFRFRAWDKNDNEMLDDISLYNDHYTNYLNEHIAYVKDKIILMQYTGLKDENGVEIYEGDIIKYSFGGSEYIGSIDYSDARFQVRDKAFRNDLDYCLNVEVIGNIYENNELINR